jgi:AcrR family transcriptional regulator
MAASTSTRRSAEERRREIVEIAISHFALNGYNGTSTDQVAREAGISQPYLFRLFRTKKELFLAVIERCFDLTLNTFREAAGKRSGKEALHAMGRSYAGLLEDRTRLLLQLQSYVACDDPDVRTLVRDGFKRLTTFVAEASGAPAEDVRHFFESGMLMNVVAAMELDRVNEPWARDLMIPTEDKR